MIEFKIIGSTVILSYTSDQSSPAWVYRELDKSGTVSIAKAFHVTKSELVSSLNEDEEHEDDPVEFKVAAKKKDYYCFSKNILSLDHDLYIHKDINLERKIFVAERGISIFGKIDSLVNNSIYIGGDNEDSIPESIFRELLKGFAPPPL